eukprot:Gb_11678 [translate_table: standard]
MKDGPVDVFTFPIEDVSWQICFANIVASSPSQRIFSILASHSAIASWSSFVRD